MQNDSLIQIIKKISRQEREASVPSDLTIGIVAKANPLEIKISSKITLDSDFFYLTQTAKNRSLSVGDKVAMLRESGGQMYLIIDKAVDA